MALEAWATTAWTPGSATSGSGLGPGRSTTMIAPSGQAPARAASTRPVVAPHARGRPRQDRVAGHQRRGRHQRRHPDRRVGGVPAEHHPVGFPLEHRAPGGRGHRPGTDRLGERRQGVEQAERRGDLAARRSGAAGPPRRPPGRRSPGPPPRARCAWARSGRSAHPDRGRRPPAEPGLPRRASSEGEVATTAQVSGAALPAPRPPRGGLWAQVARCLRGPLSAPAGAHGARRAGLRAALRPRGRGGGARHLSPSGAGSRRGARLARSACGDVGRLVPAQPRPPARPRRRARAGPGSR